MERPAGHLGRARSTPGHLLHCIIYGSYTLTTNGRQYDLKAGDVMVYHESERVEYEGLAVPVAFYSVGFIAERLPAFSMEKRKFRASVRVRNLFKRMYELSRSVDINRTLAFYAMLMQILAEIYDPQSPDTKTRGEWWEIETMIREKRAFRMSVKELADLSLKSPSTLNRLCRQAADMPVSERLRDICMEETRGLVLYSPLTVTEIAERLGYPGIHEFSREFSRHFGVSPSKYARSG